MERVQLQPKPITVAEAKKRTQGLLPEVLAEAKTEETIQRKVDELLPNHPDLLLVRPDEDNVWIILDLPSKE